MRTEADFATMWAIPPGWTIADVMASKGVLASQLACSMDISTDDLADLLNGKLALTAQIAAHLESLIGASTAFWLRREEQYRSQLAEFNQAPDSVEGEYKSWLKSLPVKDMLDLGWLSSTKDKATQLRKCLDFFDVPNLEAWHKTYGDVREATAFRTSDAYPESMPATAAWLRRGELLADRIECRDWNPAVFERQLSEVRHLTRTAAPAEFLPKLESLCAEAGVAVVVLKAPKGCRASGATFFAHPRKAVLVLSGRYLSDDQFWFSFFHEAAHLILHWNVDSLILETSDNSRSPMEVEANQFASDRLIPIEFQKRMPEAVKTVRGILKLARDAGVSGGIVVGQMQHRGLVKPNHHNRLKFRYQWKKTNR